MDAADASLQRPKYAELLGLVASGRLSVVFILGLARGGTTAVEKHLYATLGFDANVNEPTLRCCSFVATPFLLSARRNS
jgi:hypothetical protein